jgi:peptide/nickel transport system substrate-binding protein
MTTRCACLALALLLIPFSPAARLPEPAPGGELRFCLHAEPKTFKPLMVTEESGEVIQYLTGSVLIRINRRTQAFEPELAASWQVVDGGRKIEFKLRDGVRFSDGAPLTPADVLLSLSAPAKGRSW